jgi:hypothetical protein
MGMFLTIGYIAYLAVTFFKWFMPEFTFRLN